jgi:LmbE family N-acetylglucosaminyl deacetylase
VFAPHPDDEVLGCAGILRQAIAAGKRVKVAIFTNGDGFPGFAARLARKPPEQLAPADYLELARYRQSQSLAALKALGGRPEDLLFLGYPDSALEQVYLNRDAAPVRQKFTQKSETYGAAKAAPYTHAAALADAVELIRRFAPGRICVTNEADRHPDHRAAGKFVREAVAATGYAGPVDTYMVHGGPEWPWPLGITPQSPFEAHEVKGERIPGGIPWPPGRRVALSVEDARYKLAAIRAHATHLEGATEGPLAREKAYLESFVKSEEIFWTLDGAPSRK